MDATAAPKTDTARATSLAGLVNDLPDLTVIGDAQLTSMAVRFTVHAPAARLRGVGADFETIDAARLAINAEVSRRNTIRLATRAEA